MRIIDATQELEISYVGSRRRDYVQSVCESIRSNQWFPKKHEPILDGWEESDLDSGLAESLYKESEAEVDFVPSNEPLRPTSKYSESRPEPVVLSARPWSAPSSVGFRETVIEVEEPREPLPPLPPPLEEYLIDWDFLRRAGVTLTGGSGKG